jgi:hypothetical protein
MTKDDIIKLAREAGLQPYYDEQETDIEAFANLVAAAEREECAKVAEKTSGTAGANYLIAAAIRARSGEKK